MMTTTCQLPSTFDEAFHGEKGTNPWISKLTFRPLGCTGLDLSTLSWGGAFLGGFYGDVERKEAVETIQESIKSGINYLDTSPWYGDSESIIGEALVGIPRQTYYIGTKVGRNFTTGWDGRFDYSASAILKNVENSLERLRLPYVDIIQVHDVEFCQDMKMLVNETIPALESVVKAGKAKFIGITGYSLTVLEDIVRQVPTGSLNTVLSYARYNFHDDSLLKFTDFFNDSKIGTINAAPLAMGLFSTQGPPSWHPASAETKAAARSAARIAMDQGSSLEKASLQFSFHAPESITTTLVSIPNKKILEENLKIATTEPNESDRQLHQRILEVFKSTNAGHWEGHEVEKYKNWLHSQKS